MRRTACGAGEGAWGGAAAQWEASQRQHCRVGGWPEGARGRVGLHQERAPPHSEGVEE